MSSIQASIINPYNCIQKHQGSSAFGSRSRPCRVAIQTRRSFGSSSLQLTAKEVMCYQASKLLLLPVHKHRRQVPFGSFGGQGKSDSDGEGSGQKSVETAFGSIPKKLSVEEILRNQMEKQDFFDGDDGGNAGGKPPRGGGGGGGSGGGGGNLPEGEGLGEYFDEILQVILATSALLMLYIYIINGEELGKLAQDYMKYVRTGKESMRLAIARHKWGMYFKSGRDKKKDDPPDWLEKKILVTPTWYDSPDKYSRILDPEALEKAASKKKNKKKKKKDSPYKEEDGYGEKEDDYGEEEEDDYGEEEDNEDQEEEEEEVGKEEEEAASPYGDEEDDKDD